MRARGKYIGKRIRELGKLDQIQQEPESLNVRRPGRPRYRLQAIGLDGFTQFGKNGCHIAQVAGLRDMTNEVQSCGLGSGNAHGSGLCPDIDPLSHSPVVAGKLHKTHNTARGPAAWDTASRESH